MNTAARPSFVRELAGQPADPNLAAAKPAAPSSVTLDVLNGTDTVGLATRNAAQLRTLGFKVDTIDSAGYSTATTTIEYPGGSESQAKALANVVRGAKLVQTPSVSRTTLVLGTNGIQVNGLATSVPAAPATSSAGAAAKAAAHRSYQHRYLHH